jgi:hypothetical protein
VLLYDLLGDAGKMFYQFLRPFPQQKGRYRNDGSEHKYTQGDALH